MKSKVLKPGTLRAVHVFVPALMARFASKAEGQDNSQPVWAVRSSVYGYSKMMLASRVEILGPSQGVEHFDMPLPGTGGRGVALVYTTAAIRVFFDGDKPTIIDTVAVAPASAPKVEPTPAPIIDKAPIDPAPVIEASGPRQVWYTSKGGRKARYTLLGYLNGGRVARLEGEREGKPFSFRVRADEVSSI